MWKSLAAAKEARNSLLRRRRFIERMERKLQRKEVLHSSYPDYLLY